MKSSLLLGLSSFCSCSRKTLSKALKMVRNYVPSKITLEHRQQQKELTEKKKAVIILRSHLSAKAKGNTYFRKVLRKLAIPVAHSKLSALLKSAPFVRTLSAQEGILIKRKGAGNALFKPSGPAFGVTNTRALAVHVRYASTFTRSRTA